jgi:integrase
VAWKDRTAGGWRAGWWGPPDENGKRKKLYTEVYDRVRDALDDAADQEARQKRRAQLARGSLSARTTWGDWWNTITDDRERESDTDLVDDQLVRAYLMPQWGKVPLNEIIRAGSDERGAQEWVDRLAAGRAPVEMRRPGWKQRKLSPSYVQRIWSPFSWSIAVALDKQVLEASPIAGVKLPKRIKRPKKYVSQAEAEKLTTDGELRQDYADAVLFTLETGLRPGELIGLHAHRIDLEAGTLTVAETFVHRARMIRGWPKDKEARTIPLSTVALEIARRRLAGRKLNEPCGLAHYRDEKCTHVLVFLTERSKGSVGGRPLNRDAVALAMKKAAERVGIDPKSAYALRRGFATRLADAGLDAFALAELMGHADVKMVQEYVQQSRARRSNVLAALGDPGVAEVERGPLATSELVEFVVARLNEAEWTATKTDPVDHAKRDEVADLRAAVERMQGRGVTDNYFIRVLAAGYSGHRDYRREWAVTSADDQSTMD